MLIIISILNFPHSVRIAELVAFAEYIYVTALCSCWEGSISREEIIVCVGTVVIFRLTRFTFYYKLCLMFMMNTLYCTVPCAPICYWIEAVNNIHSICLLFFHIWWTQCWQQKKGIRYLTPSAAAESPSKFENLSFCNIDFFMRAERASAKINLRLIAITTVRTSRTNKNPIKNFIFVELLAKWSKEKLFYSFFFLLKINRILQTI